MSHGQIAKNAFNSSVMSVQLLLKMQRVSVSV